MLKKFLQELAALFLRKKALVKAIIFKICLSAIPKWFAKYFLYPTKNSL